MTTVFVYEHVTTSGARGQSLAPSLLAEGRAMRDAVIADFAAVPDVSVQTVPDGGEAHFRKAAANADYALIIAPETDGILEERCRWALDSKARLLGPSLDAIRLTADKLALAEHLMRAGVPHPRTWALGDEPHDLFPIVWKPRDGAGSQSTYLVSPQRQQGSFADSGSPQRQQGRYAATLAGAAGSELTHLLNQWMIAQEYSAGSAASVAFLVGPSERVALLPCHQHISDDGFLRYLGGSLPFADDLSVRAIALARKAIGCVPGLFGYVGVDLVLADDPARDCIIEINPRLTTSYVGLRRAAQFNIAEALLQVVRGKKLPNLPWLPDRILFLPDGSNLPAEKSTFSS